MTKAVENVFSEPAVDAVYPERLPEAEGMAFAVEFLPDSMTRERTARLSAWSCSRRKRAPLYGLRKYTWSGV